MRYKMKSLSLFDFAYIIVGIPWLFLMIITSRGFTEIKTILLIALFFIILFEIIIKRIKLIKGHLLYATIFVSYFILSLMLGIWSGYKFIIFEDFALIQYYVITPIMIFFLILIFKKKPYRVETLFNVLKYITLAVVVMDLCKILSFKGFIPDFDFLNLIMVASDITNSELAVRVSNEASLMFLLPFYFCMLTEKRTSRKNKIIYLSICVFGTVYALISGRKMLEIVIFLSVFTLVMLKIYSNFKHRSFKIPKISTFVLIIMLIPLLIYSIDVIEKSLGIGSLFDAAYNTLINGFSSKAVGVVKRVENMEALIKLWLNSPLVGNGLNSYAINSLAHGINFWSYEIFYVALLAQAGIVGIVIFFFLVYYILKKNYMIYIVSKNKIYLSSIFGFASFIICSASNPLAYYIWPWVICIVALYNGNYCLKHIKQDCES